jgi:hypothetical protein
MAGAFAHGKGQLSQVARGSPQVGNSPADHHVVAVGQHELEVAAADRAVGPPAVLHHPVLVHRLHRHAGELLRETVGANPHLDILGHCTGRMRTGRRSRPESRFDAEVVFAAAITGLLHGRLQPRQTHSVTFAFWSKPLEMED